jgi:uncharacterized protein YndB with AHSA1/START domain
MTIEARATIDIPGPRERVFDVAVDAARLPEYMTRKGPIPAVTSVEMLDGRAPEAGARRLVTMSDRSRIIEEIVALERPTRHVYRWLDRPAFPFSLLVRGAEAEWTFSGADGTTRVDWTYRFDLTTPLVYPLGLAAGALFRRWMGNALERLRGLVARG